jgi:hypothetical protein
MIQFVSCSRKAVHGSSHDVLLLVGLQTLQYGYSRLMTCCTIPTFTWRNREKLQRTCQDSRLSTWERTEGPLPLKAYFPLKSYKILNKNFETLMLPQNTLWSLLTYTGKDKRLEQPLITADTTTVHVWTSYAHAGPQDLNHGSQQDCYWSSTTCAL